MTRLWGKVVKRSPAVANEISTHSLCESMCKSVEDEEQGERRGGGHPPASVLISALWKTQRLGERARGRWASRKDKRWEKSGGFEAGK